MKTYLPESINILERTEYANGIGTVAFSRSGDQNSDDSSQFNDAEFIGIPEAQTVEQLIRDTFKLHNSRTHRMT